MLALLGFVLALPSTGARAEELPVPDCLEGATMDMGTSEDETPPATPPQS